MSGAFRFTFRTRADFSDTDTTGVVYYGRYPALLDRAVVAYRRQLGIDLLGPPGHHYLVKAASFTYHDSLRFDDEIVVGVRVSSIGRTSHTYAVAIDRVDPGGGLTRCAYADLTIVGVDGYGDAPTPSPMPDALRATITAFEGLE